MLIDSENAFLNSKISVQPRLKSQAKKTILRSHILNISNYILKNTNDFLVSLGISLRLNLYE
jgi:hypothetical protein